MFGSWLLMTIAGILAVGLAIALAFTPAAPVFAIPIALLLFFAAMAVVRLRKGAAETSVEDQAAARAENRPERPDAGKAEPSH